MLNYQRVTDMLMINTTHLWPNWLGMVDPLALLTWVCLCLSENRVPLNQLVNPQFLHFFWGVYPSFRQIPMAWWEPQCQAPKPSPALREGGGTRRKRGRNLAAFFVIGDFIWTKHRDFNGYVSGPMSFWKTHEISDQVSTWRFSYFGQFHGHGVFPFPDSGNWLSFWFEHVFIFDAPLRAWKWDMIKQWIAHPNFQI